MLSRIGCTLLALLAVAQPGIASSITYDFSGTTQLNGPGAIPTQPVPFSGSFTINGDPSVQGSGVIFETNGVSATLNFGGDVFHSYDKPSPTGYSPLFTDFQMYPTSPEGNFSAGSPNDEIFVDGRLEPVSSTNKSFITSSELNVGYFALKFNDSAALESLSNLRDLDFPLNQAGSFYFEALPNSGGSWLEANGTVTSITLVATPEPGTLAGFATVAIALMFRRRRHRS